MNLDIESIFSYHPATSVHVQHFHETVRSEVKAVAQIFMEDLPDCPEKTIAIRKLQEAMMFANSAIAQHAVD